MLRGRVRIASAVAQRPQHVVAEAIERAENAFGVELLVSASGTEEGWRSAAEGIQWQPPAPPAWPGKRPFGETDNNAVSMEPTAGLEPATCGLRNRCSTN